MSQQVEKDDTREIWGELVSGIHEIFEFGKMVFPIVANPNVEAPAKDQFESLGLNARQEILELIASQLQQVKGFKRILNKMMLINGISVFESFYQDLLKVILRKSQNAIIKANKNIEYLEVFKHPNLESLLDYLIDKEIFELSHKSIKDQFSEIKKKYGFSISDISKDVNYPVKEQFRLDLNRLAEIFATRNILVHNRGIINEQYQKNATEEFNIGDLRPLSEEYVSNSLEYLLIFGTELISYANNKYKK